MKSKELEFYPSHPSMKKTHLIETTYMPVLNQVEPFLVNKLLEEFKTDLYKSLDIYEDKRFEIEGIAIQVGPDVHNKPSIQISNKIDGECCALTIFPNKDFYKEVSVGDRVVVRANYLVLSNLFGVVMKNSELVKVVKSNEGNY